MEKISSIKGGDETLMMFNQQQKLNTAGASAVSMNYWMCVSCLVNRVEPVIHISAAL